MSNYYNFSKAKFEYELKGISIRNKFSSFVDVTDRLRNIENNLLERVYFLTTKNKSVGVLIYSSIDLRTDRVREKGSDAIRLVLVWETKKGNLYKKIAKHLRVTSIFNNLENTLIKVNNDSSNLKVWEFVKDLKQVK
jgi:hypothetical protein